MAQVACKSDLMLGRLYGSPDCSAAPLWNWSGSGGLLILHNASFRNYRHFSEFERSAGTAPNILAKRLLSLVDAGILAVARPLGRSDPKVYLLTERGRALRPVLIALKEWGDAWLQPGPVEFVDAAGAAVRLSTTRRCDDGRVDVADVIARRRY